MKPTPIHSLTDDRPCYQPDKPVPIAWPTDTHTDRQTDRQKPKVHYASRSETRPQTCLLAGGVCLTVRDHVTDKSTRQVADLFDVPLRV